MNDTRRALLDALASGPVTGPGLAERLDVSRAAVWKQVEALRDEGFGIESTGDGYVVSDVPPYGAAAIEYGLDAPFSVEYHDSIGSTNDRARELAAEGAEDVAVVADEQVGSRGRLKREWTAPSGGVWVSLLVRPQRPPAHVPVFTLAAAVAATRACREAGVDASIKWPNDLLVSGTNEGQSTRSADAVSASEASGGDRGGKKLAGILTEMEGEADRVSWLVAGIGVNANVDAADLPEGATSLREQLGEDVDRRLFVQRLLEEFADLRDNPDDVLPAWRAHSATLGQRVRVETPGGVVEGRAVDVEFPGALVVRTGRGDVTVHAGDCEHLRPV
ncbi:BirA family transcriptional regulator, biotin operon repressor / biotin-[acetyl-CoA-carboxylase] ligase [Halogranum gelatinilyticum]|uniref:BirA family transcriptional regulator, biotin operon repressor / biotin-[acetyl-CoA-carboxylase] ligase n=1 Tax=Halogranum gelatinilyticum TaxID=660521 RepID=A0A1G9TBP1_9EURY|nr:biotin--[acetyl-CoA-carboxylase] ligase [Halogranum gelatinilyticum]SDM45103.1 BirA family transcriptional regulator, biotin operon repressor / biotin-[acetyl-CoA-carboxylase] ligase [Halogranum gelatinilyticum]